MEHHVLLQIHPARKVIIPRRKKTETFNCFYYIHTCIYIYTYIYTKVSKIREYLPQKNAKISQDA